VSPPEQPGAGPAAELLVRYGELMFRWRNLAFPLVSLALFAAFRPLPPGDGPGLASDLAGIALALAGQALRVAVVGLAYIKRGGMDKRVYADELVTGGLFGHCRNPLYVGNALILLGLLLIHGAPEVIALGALFFAVTYRAIVAAEERYLEARFGAAYRDYCRRVPRWGLRLAGMRETLASMRFNWRRVLAKEYSSFASAVLAACALLAYEVLSAGDGGGSALLIGVVVAAAAVVVATLAVRLLKKGGKLREGTA